MVTTSIAGPCLYYAAPCSLWVCLYAMLCGDVSESLFRAQVFWKLGACMDIIMGLRGEMFRSA